jgi:subtilisin family serine protease
MAKKNGKDSSNDGEAYKASSTVEELLLAALERGGDTLETGRYLVTFKEGAAEEGLQSLGTQGMRVADTRDFDNQGITMENVGDADAVVFPEIGVALVSGNAAQERSMGVFAEVASDSPIESIDPEYFVFPEHTNAPAMDPMVEYLEDRIIQTADDMPTGYLRGFLRAAETIARDLRDIELPDQETQEEIQVLGATWGLRACKVPPSLRSGLGIKVAVLDTGMDLGHPDFAGRPIVNQTFVGQPVQDLNGHGTHCIGTACGPKAPVGNIPRYGIGFRSSIFAGKVLTNAGSGTQAGVLAGMNWAIANRCQIISMSLGSQSPVHPAYTAAGRSALNNNCLIIAAAGNSVPPRPTGAPANSPTIMAVASLDPDLKPSAFSNFGKIDIAAPGRDVFSSWPRPTRYRTISGTSMATPHVAGCAALWAETSPNLRGITLWRKLLSTARRLPFPASRVGAGLVQAP